MNNQFNNQERHLRSLLEGVRDKSVDIDQALDSLRDLPYQDLGFAKLDHHRPLRTGAAEVVLGRGKTPEQVSEIVAALSGRGHLVLVTKTDPQAYQAVLRQTPDATFNELASAIVLEAPDPAPKAGSVAVVSAGATDLPVAEEAAITAELMGNQVIQIRELAIADGDHVRDQMPVLRKARVIVVVAGMEALLAEALAVLAGVPVIAVPTGPSLKADADGPAPLLAPLMTMVNGCAPGVALVNIDNGFGAGFLASQINHMNLG